MILPTYNSTTSTYSADTAVSGTSDWIRITNSMRHISVAVHPAAGVTAGVEYTLSSIDDVAAGTAKWLLWNAGMMAQPFADSLTSIVTAVRGKSEGGAATLEFLARW